MSKKNKKRNASDSKNDMIIILMLVAAIVLGVFNLFFYGVNVFSLGMTILAVLLLGRKIISWIF